MRKHSWTVAALILLQAGAIAQQSSPRPNSDGVYSVGEGVTAPKLIHAVPAIYPHDQEAMGKNRASLVTVTIGADGVPELRPSKTNGDAFQAAAIEAVRQSEFEPGTVDGKPVPTRIRVVVPFLGEGRPATPVIPTKTSFTTPVLVERVEAEYTDEARRKKINGSVVISMDVSEAGAPENMRFLASLQYGLDQQALKAVRKYRFKAATFEGKPVRFSMSVEINFHIYGSIHGDD